MLMVLGLVVFLILAGSAVLGVLMLLIGAGLSASRRWRRAGVIALSAGLCGSLLSVLGLLALTLSMGSRASTETWVLFAAAGFGWGALVALGFYVLASLLGHPNRWVDRKRNARMSGY